MKTLLDDLTMRYREFKGDFWLAVASFVVMALLIYYFK